MTITDPDQQRGLYGKYLVYKPDPETGELRDPGSVFVLNYATDPHARVALRAYAQSCANDYPQLANDLMRKLDSSFEFKDGRAVLRDDNLT